MSLANLLKLSCFLLLLGRGWQCFFWDIPLRALLWNEALLSPIVEGVFGVVWQDYANSPTVDRTVNLISKAMGLFLFASSLVVFKLPRLKKWQWVLPMSSFILLIIFLLGFISKFFYVGYFIEHSIQLFVPVLYWKLLIGDMNKKLLNTTKLACSLTFLGHALFAVGYYPVPGGFVDMLINVFGVSNETATLLLSTVGSIDMAAALFLFLPVVDRYALIFMAVWGLVTAMARFVAHFDFALAQATSHQWLAETVYRLPHGLIPLILLLYLYQSKKLERITA